MQSCERKVVAVTATASPPEPVVASGVSPRPRARGGRRRRGRDTAAGRRYVVIVVIAGAGTSATLNATPPLLRLPSKTSIPASSMMRALVPKMKLRGGAV